MRHRYENWVERPQRRLADLPPALLRRARSRSGTRSTPTATSTTTSPILADRGGAADRPVDRRARRASTRRSAASPAASSATPTSWTPGPRRRSRPRSPAGWEDDADLFARTFPMDLRPAGPRDHPHLAVLHRRARPPRARRRCRGPTPRSRAGSSTPTARRCRSRRATSSRPIGLLEQYGADAVRYWAASGRPGTDTAFDEGQMKVGRRLAIKLLNVSRFALGLGDGAGARPPRPSPSRSTGPCSPGWPTWSTRPPRPSRRYDYARALERTEAFFWWFCDDYLELVKGRAYGVARRRRPRVGPGRAAARALDVCSGCSPRSCRSSPRRSGRGGRTGSVHRASWPDADGRGRGGRRRPTPPRSIRSSTCWPRCARPRRRPRCRCGRRWPR